MKIYCDSANIKEIRKSINSYKVDGITTNPSLMRKDNVKNYQLHCKRILKVIKNLPISFEVFGDNISEIRRQALIISSWGKNIFVKIPITNSRGVFMGKIINELNEKNIKLNITAVYTAGQTSKILKKINKKTKVIISIFAGRMADAGKDPVPEFKKSVKFAKKFKNAEILWASTREPYNFLQAKQLECNIITSPLSIIEKVKKFGKSFDKLTTDTVKTFYKDGKKSKFKI